VGCAGGGGGGGDDGPKKRPGAQYKDNTYYLFTYILFLYSVYSFPSSFSNIIF
jgi:hypothetical protein